MNPGIPTYLDVISTAYPTLDVSAFGDGSDYTTLTVAPPGVLPTKATLDTLIMSGTIDKMWKLIQAERDRRTQTGGYKVGTSWFHSDQNSRTQQIALVILGAGLPAGIMWKTMSGTFVQMSPALAQGIFGTAVQSDQAIFGRAERHKAAMMAAPDPSVYDFSTGWPLTYAEANP